MDHRFQMINLQSQNTMIFQLQLVGSWCNCCTIGLSFLYAVYSVWGLNELLTLVNVQECLFIFSYSEVPHILTNDNWMVILSQIIIALDMSKAAIQGIKKPTILNPLFPLYFPASPAFSLKIIRPILIIIKRNQIYYQKVDCRKS